MPPAPFPRRLLCIPVLLLSGPCQAWDNAPHQNITRAAFDTLPKASRDRFGAEVEPLVEIYSMLPDRYTEMVRFGFVRKGPGPRDPAEIRAYCVRPDGQPVHGATGDRASDTGSLVFLFERILTSFSANRPGEAARYAGVLSHFIADSLSPPHAITPEQLRAMAPQSAQTGGFDIHSTIERSIPAFTLGNRAPRAASPHLLAAAQAILDRCYEGAAKNEEDMPSIVKAASARDERALDVYRLRAGVTAAAILADALYTLSRLADAGR